MGDLSEPNVLNEPAVGEFVLTAPLNSASSFHIRAGRQAGSRQTRHHRLEVFDTTQYGLVLRVDGRNTTAERDAFAHHENLIHPVLTAHAGAPPRLRGGAPSPVGRQALRSPADPSAPGSAIPTVEDSAGTPGSSGPPR